MPLYRFAVGMSLCWLSYPLLATASNIWMWLAAIALVYFGMKPLLSLILFGHHEIDGSGRLITKSDTDRASSFAINCLAIMEAYPISVIPFLLIAPLAFCLYPLFAAIRGLFKGRGFFRSLYQGIADLARFTIRITLALAILGAGLAGPVLGVKALVLNS